MALNTILFQADKLAAGLLNAGLEKGDTVGIWSPNYEFWIISMIAMARAGLVCVIIFKNSIHLQLQESINFQIIPKGHLKPSLSATRT